MKEKRLKDQIKDVKRKLREQRRLFETIALPGRTHVDIELLDKTREKIKALEREYHDLYDKYVKKET